MGQDHVSNAALLSPNFSEAGRLGTPTLAGDRGGQARAVVASKSRTSLLGSVSKRRESVRGRSCTRSA